MYKSTTISAQLLALADRLGFGKICLEEKADKRYRNFTARTQFYAMMVAQLTDQNGLRSIENAIKSDGDLKLIKQNLRVKRFYGQSENAVKTQIWIALIVHLLFLILKAQNRESDRTFIIQNLTFYNCITKKTHTVFWCGFFASD